MSWPEGGRTGRWWSGLPGAGVLALVLALAGCGFTPVYGPEGTASGYRGAVGLPAPNTEEEFAFTARLEDRLGRVQVPRYDLAFTLTTSETDLAIDDSNNITRFNVEGRLQWTLNEGDTVLLAGEETAFTAYSATGSTISTLESERDARRRLMVILADKVVGRLLAS